MIWLAALFASGRITDIIIGLTVVEGLALTALFRRLGRPIPIAFNLAAGACLLLALRAALTGAAWPWIALCLAGSLLMHGGDLWRRWRSHLPSPVPFLEGSGEGGHKL